MSITSATIQKAFGGAPLGYATELDSSSVTALELKGMVREDFHPIFGHRKFQYLRNDQPDGCTAGQLVSFKPNTSAGTITGGSTTTVVTSGLTADIHVDSLLVVTDNNDSAGAAPEGESGRIVANTASLIKIATDDAATVAIAASDTATIITPWAVTDSAAGHFASQVAGVALADQDQYDYGWYQFYGINPLSEITTAALPVGESLVADVAALGDGAGAAIDLRVAVIKHGVTADQVRLFGVADLFCGSAFKMNASTA